MTDCSPSPTEIGNGVYELRLGAHETLSSFLIVDDEPTLVDAATASALEDIVKALHTIGLDPATLSNVIVSHIHLDHSGAAAGLAARADDLDVYVHESTAHHLVDPTDLIESTKRALGDEFERMGAPDPLARDHIETVSDAGRTLDIGDHSLDIIHTPGHSPDHVSVDISGSPVTFTNEAIGRYYPRADCWVPPVTVPNFDATAVADSIELLEDIAAGTIGLSHVGTMAADDALTRAGARLEEFTTLLPEWYAETDDLGRTTARVREQLLSFEDEYPETLMATQARLCTRGLLDSLGIL